jgi:hypothetical protein
MSGSPTPGYKPTPPANPCSRLSFQATVNSPKPDVISHLTVGDVLNVALNPEGQGVVLGHNGQLAGSIVGSHVVQLVNCINSGFDYQATVVQLNGGHCVVRIDPK